MIEGISTSDPVWEYITRDVERRIESMMQSLVKANDPLVIHRLQGGIIALQALIDTQSVVSPTTRAAR